MTIFLDTENSLDQLDRELRDLTREHGHVFDLDPFRRHLDTDERPIRESAGPADAPSASRTESQLRHELNLVFTDLGAAAFALAHHGTLTDSRLAPRVQHIHDLYAHLDAIPHATPGRVRPSQPRPGRWALVQVFDGAVLASFYTETSAREAMIGVDDDEVVVLHVGG
jgi:hypothetical protein